MILSFKWCLKVINGVYSPNVNEELSSLNLRTAWKTSIHIVQFYQSKMILKIDHQMVVSGKTNPHEEFFLQPLDGISPFSRSPDPLVLILFVSGLRCFLFCSSFLYHRLPLRHQSRVGCTKEKVFGTFLWKISIVNIFFYSNCFNCILQQKNFFPFYL